MAVSIKGRRGDWFAEAEGVRLPVLHDGWLTDNARYSDPMLGVKPHWKRYREYVSALQEGDLAIMQRDRNPPEDLSRAGYKGVFRYCAFSVEPDGAILLTVLECVARPRK